MFMVEAILSDINVPGNIENTNVKEQNPSSISRCHQPYLQPHFPPRTVHRMRHARPHVTLLLCLPNKES